MSDKYKQYLKEYKRDIVFLESEADKLDLMPSGPEKYLKSHEMVQASRDIVKKYIGKLPDEILNPH